jgi:hypothetical protein
MAYTLKLSNGQLLLNLPDQQSDKVTTSLTLIGKNVNAYGTDINQNYIKILENFANSTPPPGNNLVGQVWYDSAKQQLKVFTASNQYKPVGAPIISATRPPTLSPGDLWYDTTTQQLKFLETSANLVVIGPATDVTVGKSGWVTEIYNTATNQAAEGLYSNGKLLGILSDRAFTASTTLTNLTEIGVGLTANTSDGLPFEFFGTATYATALIKDTNGVKSVVTASQFLVNAPPNIRFDYPVTIISSLTNALEVGYFQDLVFYQQGYISGITTVASQVTATIAVNNTNEDFELTVKSGGDPFKDPPIHIDSSNAYIGIFNRTPTTDLDIIGDVKITGDLIVTGASTEITTEKIQLTDKVFTLAFDPTGLLDAAQRDTNADGAGIVVKAATDKEFKWYFTSPDTGSQNIWSLTDDLELRYSTSTYRIANQIVLSQTALGPSVTSALGLTQIGQLQTARIAGLQFNTSSTYSTLTSYTSLVGVTNPDTIIVIGDGQTRQIEFAQKKLINVASPVIGDSSSTVATKGYVDDMIDVSRNVKAGITIDVTGEYVFDPLNGPETIASSPIDPNLDDFVIEMLSKIFDPTIPVPYDTPNGTIAKVMVVRYSTPTATVTSGPIDLGLPVDVFNTIGDPEQVINYNQNLVATATFDLDANTPLTVNRAIKQYIVSPTTGLWTTLDFPIASGSGTNLIWDDGTW